MSYKIVIINQKNKLYVREYQEYPQWQAMIEKLKRSKTQEIRYTCDNEEAIPKHILKEMELSKMAKKNTKETTPPMAQLENTVPDPTMDYEDIAPIRLTFNEYKKINNKWYKAAPVVKEFHTPEESKTWINRHILAKVGKIVIEYIEPDFMHITINGLRNYSKSIKIQKGAK